RCWPRSTCTGPGSGWGGERCEIVLVGVPVRPGCCVPPHLPGGVESGAWPHRRAVQTVADHGGSGPIRPPAPTSDRRPARRGVGRAGGVAPGGVAGAAGRAGRRRCSVCAGAGPGSDLQRRRVYVMTCLRHLGLTRGRESETAPATG